MLPDIDTPNKRFAVSGLGAYEGHGILSRSFEDLHPQPERYEVVWNGSIEAQTQRSEQRRLRAEDMRFRRGEMIAAIKDILRASGPLATTDLAARSGLNFAVVEATMRRLALKGELSVCDQLREASRGRKKFVRVYSLPKMARKDQAA